ncbi:FAD/NAD(P)-binding domain-containing protein [Gymnopus androsaceus JB14]|uniref:FAD/NAD(P)-binding domain-containing protein n=1 Tax=Gymnopus androsaceus JB14 TaxID=1447944 RepID=A0A6A4HG00_9AGAR|nr:FAD/NAD(P)-binding domain-containing protein [Gymnopus androsaceus JB14]
MFYQIKIILPFPTISTRFSMTFDEKTAIKTVLVLGGAYAGSRAIRILSEGIPKGWRIVLVDRNTHINHVYIFPRLAVLPGHEQKGFVPLDKLLDSERKQDLYLHAAVQSVHSSHVVLDRSFPNKGIPTQELHFDYLIYALGSRLPAPLDLWGSHPGSGSMSYKAPAMLRPYNGTKKEGMAWLKAHQDVIKGSGSVLVVGGGALGIQFAADISAIYPDKTITLLHSRQRLLPRFDEKMHTEILDTLQASDIQVILGERLDMNSTSDTVIKTNEQGQRIVRTMQGREVVADLILLCTGQKPNTHFISEMDSRCVNPRDGLAHVLSTMQLGVLSPPSAFSSECTTPAMSESSSLSNSDILSPEKELEEALAQVALAEADENNAGFAPSDLPKDSEETVEKEITPYPNIFVIGDAADAFGAIPAGHTAYYQGEVAARNILRLIRRSKHEVNSSEMNILKEEPMESYEPGLPVIKVSLGLVGIKSVYQVNGVVGTSNDGIPDLNAAAIWGCFGYEVNGDEEMYI